MLIQNLRLPTYLNTMRSIFLTAEWRKLAIVNYAVDPAMLKAYLPYKTELDFWKDNCYVSLVGFRFINTKLRGISIPFHTQFEEINLRFYVKYKEGNAWKRGVTFIREIVPKPALTIVANSIYKEKYITLPTRHSWKIDPDEIHVSYEWKFKGVWDSLNVTSLATPTDILPGTEEEFITEHYWGYTPVSRIRTSQYQVEHPRWQTYSVKSHRVNVRFSELYGPAFGILNNAVPDSIMLAEGSSIKVRAANRIK